MEQIIFDTVSPFQLYVFNGLCLIGLVWLLWKYHADCLVELVVLLFFEGVANDLFGGTGRNVYRILLLAVCLWKSFDGSLNLFYQHHQKAFYAFCVYCIYFIIDSIVVNGDNPLLTFSLLSKVIIPFLLLTLIVKRQDDDGEYANKLFWVFEQIIILQILISLSKLVIIGGFLEGWVGSMTGIRGGGAGTSFPLLGLMWLALKNDMSFNKKDVLIAVGLLALGFMAGKRAVWILFPILFVALSLFVYNKNMTRQITMVVLLLPILCYLAIRISPTFNPEKKVWGSFDPEYAINYIMNYSGGINDSNQRVQTGKGRLGAVAWFVEQLDKDDQSIYTGKGNEYFTYANADDYSNASYYGGVKSRGSITGIVSMFMTLGLIGVALFLLFLCSFFLSYKSRYCITLFVVVIFDYIFYNAQIVAAPCLLFFAFYLSFMSPTLMSEDEEDTSQRNVLHEIED